MKLAPSVTPPLASRSPISTTRVGFTLIELSIVLVIIGLIAGGILVGQELISTSYLRATMSQIQSYNTAVHTFQSKYGYLPGDIPDPYASRWGLKARGPYPGQGDGNGVIEGNHNNTSTGDCNAGAFAGESVMFWVDLSTAGFISDTFTVASPFALPPYGDIALNSTPPYTLSSYLPVPKLGNGNFIYVWSATGINYYTFAKVTDLGWGLDSVPSLTVAQAYYLDKKYDDGYPQTGLVTAQYIYGGGQVWSAGGGLPAGSFGTPDTSPTRGSSITCYDNGMVSGARQQYSMEISSGTGVNCAPSFQFQ